MSNADNSAAAGTPEASIVVPTYEEAENIPELVRRVDATLKGMDITYEIIIVDDFSGDGTRDIVTDLQNKEYPLHLITRHEKRDLSSAVLHGFSASSGKTLVCMDADLSHPPELLPALIEPIRDDRADFVVGSRYVEGGSVEEGWGTLRWLNSRVASLLARPLTRVKDPMSGFFALHRTTFLRGEHYNPLGYKIGLELMVKCSPAKLLEVPITFAKRKRGASKLSLREQMKYLAHILQLLAYNYFRRK